MILAHGAQAAGSGWTWHAHPDVWALAALTVVAYAVAVRVVGPTKVAAGESVVSRRQVVLFGLGVFALWAHSDWPIHDISENYLYSVHMVQHVGFTLIAPPLLLLSLPAWMWRWLFVDRPRVHAVVRRLAKPLAAGILFNVVAVLTHWPLIVDYTLYHHASHFFVHAGMFLVAVLMWMPVVNRQPELPVTSYPVKMMYLFLQSVIPTIPASFLTFGDTVLYKFYAHAPRPFSISALEDQQLAGAMMKVYAGSILWGIIVLVFFRWYAREQTRERRDEALPNVLTWDDVERELERSEPVS